MKFIFTFSILVFSLVLSVNSATAQSFLQNNDAITVLKMELNEMAEQKPSFQPSTREQNLNADFNAWRVKRFFTEKVLNNILVDRMNTEVAISTAYSDFNALDRTRLGAMLTDARNSVISALQSKK